MTTTTTKRVSAKALDTLATQATALQREYAEARDAAQDAREALRQAQERARTAQAASEAFAASIKRDYPALAAFVDGLAGLPARPQERKGKGKRATTRKLDGPPCPQEYAQDAGLAKAWARGVQYAHDGKPASDNPFTHNQRRDVFTQAYNASAS